MKTLKTITSINWQPHFKKMGEIVEGNDDIKQAINIILTTSKGLDPHRPDFGCNIHHYIDWPIERAIPFVTKEIIEAISKWEPRIKVVGVKIENNNSQLLINIKWQALDKSINQTVISMKKTPVFVEINPEKMEQELVARYEKMTAKTLYPAQIERLFINQINYALIRALSAIQHTGEQLLVDYSEAPIIDYLGDLVGVKRLSAQPASTTLKFSLNHTELTNIDIPTFTLVSDSSGDIQFMTSEPVTIAAGKTTAFVVAYCCNVGSNSNGIALGELNRLVEYSDKIAVENITITSGGYDEEDTPSLRKRIKLAPESYSNAGSYGAYEFHARSVHQSILDVAVLGPNKNPNIPSGTVEIYPLTTQGLPSAELIKQVQDYISDEKIRPLCDTVIVKSPELIEYRIKAKLTLTRNYDKQHVLSAIRSQLDNWLLKRSTTLGLDIVPHQIKVALSGNGVYDIELIEPVNTQILEHYQWVHCIAVDLEISGVSDE